MKAIRGRRLASSSHYLLIDHRYELVILPNAIVTIAFAKINVDVHFFLNRSHCHACCCAVCGSRDTICLFAPVSKS